MNARGTRVEATTEHTYDTAPVLPPGLEVKVYGGTACRPVLTCSFGDSDPHTPDTARRVVLGGHGLELGLNFRE